MELFDKVFWQVVGTIDAPREILEELMPELRDAYGKGDSRYMHAAVQRHLPEGAWRWGAYDAYAESRDRAFADEDNEPIDVWEPDYHEMVVLLCRRISAIIYGYERYEQLSDPGLLALRPRWRFHWGEEGAQNCSRFDGKALPASEARHAFPSIPCECLTCTCYLSADS
jgi:hypothetical protein